MKTCCQDVNCPQPVVKAFLNIISKDNNVNNFALASSTAIVLSHQSEIQHQERVSYLSDSGPIESPDITSVRCTLVTLTLPLVLIAVTIDIFVILLDSYKYTYRNPIKSGIIIMNVPCH